MSTRPNILFFFTDDQRFDTINALGNPHIHTPNINRLVERGTAFTRAHIMGGTSQAVCMPSRAMLHTGRSLFSIQEQGQTIDPDHVMLGEALQQNGYTSHGLGKWHNGKGSFNRAFSSGDEIYLGGMCDPWELCNLAQDPALDEQKDVLRTLLETFRTAHGDTRAQGQTFWSGYDHARRNQKNS